MDNTLIFLVASSLPVNILIPFRCTCRCVSELTLTPEFITALSSNLKLTECVTLQEVITKNDCVVLGEDRTATLKLIKMLSPSFDDGWKHNGCQYFQREENSMSPRFRFNCSDKRVYDGLCITHYFCTHETDVKWMKENGPDAVRERCRGEREMYASRALGIIAPRCEESSFYIKRVGLRPLRSYRLKLPQGFTDSLLLK